MENKAANEDNLKSYARHSNKIKSLYLSKLIREDKIKCDTLVINEFANFYSGARADIAIIREEDTEAIEIKSSSDNLSRLERQIQAYVECFNKVTIVTEDKHLKNVVAMTSGTTVGIVLFDGKNFKNVKRSKKVKIQRTIIDERLIPQKLRKEYGRYEDYVNYLRKKYHKNMEYLQTMIQSGCVTERDVSTLNPSNVRREKFTEMEKSVDLTWNKLATNLQINPVLFSKAGNCD